MGLAAVPSGPVVSVLRWSPGNANHLLVRLRPMSHADYQRYLRYSLLFQNGGKGLGMGWLYGYALQLYGVGFEGVDVAKELLSPHDDFFAAAKTSAEPVALPPGLKSLLFSEGFFRRATTEDDTWKERQKTFQAFLGLMALDPEAMVFWNVAKLADYIAFRMDAAGHFLWNNFPAYFASNRIEEGVELTDEAANEQGGFGASYRLDPRRVYQVFATDHPRLAKVLRDYRPRFERSCLRRIQRLLYEAWWRMASYPEANRTNLAT